MSEKYGDYGGGPFMGERYCELRDEQMKKDKEAAEKLPIEGVISPWIPERDPYVLAKIGKLGEEATELAKICFRIMIQGIAQSDPETKRPNTEELSREIADVLACITIVYDAGYAGTDNYRRDAKIKGFKKWHKLIDEYFEKIRKELDEGPPLGLTEQMSWKRPLVIKAWQEGLSARACARIFDVSHEAAASWVKGMERPKADACKEVD